MHRWHFQRLIRWLVPVIIFLLLVCIVIVEQKSSGVGLSFPTDDAYKHHVVAGTMLEYQTYGIAADRYIPAIQDVPWRLLLTLLAGFMGNGTAALYLLGTVCGVATLLVVLRMARLLFPFPLYITYTTMLLVIAPSLVLDAVSGTALPLATLLITAACLSHIAALVEERPCLPATAAVLVGLAAWIRIEFALLWIIFSLHAAIVLWFKSKDPTHFPFAVVRSISGTLILALIMFPIFVWNFWVMRVVWPRVGGAPMSLDMWGNVGAGSAIKSGLDISAASIHASYSHLFGIPFLNGPVEFCLAIFGLCMIAGLAFFRHEERYYTVVPCVALVFPLLYALVYPYVGWASASMVYSAFSPLFVLVAAFGIFRIPFFIEWLYRKWKEGLPTASGFNAWWIVMGLILFITCLARNGAMIRDRMEQLQAVDGARTAIAKGIADGSISGSSILTDQPGWLASSTSAEVLDLRGELSPIMLACVGDGGALDKEKLERVLGIYKPDVLIFEDDRYQMLLSAFPTREIAVPINENLGEGPHVHQMLWSDKP